MQAIICENADVNWWKMQNCLKTMKNYFINLTEDLMPQTPCYWSVVMMSVEADMREWQIWERQMLVLSVFSPHSCVTFADTEVTKAMDPLNQTVSLSRQRLQEFC